MDRSGGHDATGSFQESHPRITTKSRTGRLGFRNIGRSNDAVPADARSRFGLHICPAIDDFAIFSSFLRDNPTARGNIIVRDPSPSIARQKAGRVAMKLQLTHGINADGFEPSPRYLSGLRTTTRLSYWFLP